MDDNEDLTELYITLLVGAGYSVRAFNDRFEAIASLEMETNKPLLLITDYRGHSMAVDYFIHRCLALHPTLRVLMASGLHHEEMDSSFLGVDRCLQKPFTPTELLHEVREALNARELGRNALGEWIAHAK